MPISVTNILTLEITFIFMNTQVEVLVICYSKLFQKYCISEEEKKKAEVKYIFEKVKICCYERINGQISMNFQSQIR